MISQASTFFSQVPSKHEVDMSETIKNKGGQFQKKTVVLRQWEYYKIIWFYQLGW